VKELWEEMSRLYSKRGEKREINRIFAEARTQAPLCEIEASRDYIQISCGQSFLRLGSWKFMTSGNRREILCLQRRIAVVPWMEVSKIVWGDIRAS